ncbi:MAG: GAF domain-containing protein [Acidobacteria bacterium]|nr:GAF domain-containing protein [Acidobacteriota bacterium]
MAEADTLTPTQTSSEAQAPKLRRAEALLLEVADAMNTTLDLDTLLRRVAEVVRGVLDYEIFAILLLHEKRQELRARFQIGHLPETVEGLRIKVGTGVTGRAVERREAVLVNDVSEVDFYISAHPGVRSELAVPLIVKNRIIGVLDLQARQVNYFTPEHSRMLTLVASRLAAGIENARLYTRVARQARTLEVLNEISREVTSILDLDQLLQRVAELLKKLIEYDMFSILLLDEAGTRLQHRFAVRFDEKVALKPTYCVGEGLVGFAAQHKQSLLVPDVHKDPRYLELNPETKSELVVPLILKDQVIGVLDLEHTKRAYFTEDHLRSLTTLAAQVAIAVENARLYEHVVKQERRLESDLDTARELQLQLLPAECPRLQHARVAARFEPAYAIGGDLYDFLDYSLERTGLAIGDVSGKGARAALYASLVSGLVRSTAISEPSAAEMLSAINLSLYERNIDAQYVSIIYAVWDDRERTLQIANSGLPRPLHCHQGTIQTVESTGLPLGLFGDAEYEEQTLSLAPGDVIVFFSDGILDARTPDGESFGRKRLEQVVTETCAGSAEDVVNAIFDATCEYCHDLAPFDDKTVVVIKVLD